MGPLPSTRKPPAASSSGSQTLLRGLDVIEAVASGATSLVELSDRLDLTRSTAHRLASALVERRYLSFVPREGYSLGPKLLELGFGARQQTNLTRLSREPLEALSMASEDTVHLGVMENDRALYLEKIPGRRRVEIGSRVGEQQPVTSTGLGKALILDLPEQRWHELYVKEQGKANAGGEAYKIWLKRMRVYAKLGHAFDLEENEDQIRCVSAPVREASGRIVAAISLSSAAQYMSDARMNALASDVKTTANSISRQLGWNG